jgi:ABC-type transport system involved in multi-copper enzyme maturation permease subunit
MIGLLRSEVLKVRTTAVWWGMLIGVVGLVAVSLLVDSLVVNAMIDSGGTPTQDGTLEPLNTAQNAVRMYVSGSYFGTLLAMLLGILLMTNEQFHQTMTATFLVTPRRLRVVAAKVLTAAGWGIAFGLVATVLTLPVGASVLAAMDQPTLLDDGSVWTSIGLNLASYALWAVFGVGFGTLIRSQIVAVVIALGLKLVAETAVSIVLFVLASQFNQDWILKITYALPSTASQVFSAGPAGIIDAGGSSATPMPWWGGGLILLGYGMLAAGVGGLIVRRRDVS